MSVMTVNDKLKLEIKLKQSKLNCTTFYPLTVSSSDYTSYFLLQHKLALHTYQQSRAYDNKVYNL